MRRAAELIVAKRNLIFAGFMVLFIFCLFMIPRVEVENELTSYLAEDTETRRGLDLMEEQFVTLGTAKVMVENIDFHAAQELADRLREVRGVSQVEFYEETDEDAEENGEITDAEALRDVYTDLSALFSITFEGEEEETAVQHAMAEIRELLADYDTYVYTTVDKDDSAELQDEMGVILVIAVVIITLVLSYFTLVFGELVPKRLAMKKSEQMALGISGILYLVAKVFAPLVWLLTVSTNLVLRLMGISPEEEEDQVTEEEIRMLLMEGSQQGNIQLEETQMIRNVFEFDDISVDEIRTHRRETVMLYLEDSLEEWDEVIRSRPPSSVRSTISRSITPVRISTVRRKVSMSVRARSTLRPFTYRWNIRKSGALITLP